MESIRVEIRLYALLAELAGTRRLELMLPAGAQAHDALERVVEQHPELDEQLGRFRIALDQEYVEEDAELRDGSVLALIPPVSGGENMSQSEEFTPFLVTDEPLDPEPLVEYCTTNRMGAVITFAGTVREFTGDHQTSYLEYEAYPDMATKLFREIAAEIEEKWPGTRVAVAHRTGRLDIGETSVLVVVGSPHRAEAFEACRYGIDELKERAPIWKKEVYAEGSHWVGSKQE